MTRALLGSLRILLRISFFSLLSMNAVSFDMSAFILEDTEPFDVSVTESPSGTGANDVSVIQVTICGALSRSVIQSEMPGFLPFSFTPTDLNTDSLVSVKYPLPSSAMTRLLYDGSDRAARMSRFDAETSRTVVAFMDDPVILLMADLAPVSLILAMIW